MDRSNYTVDHEFGMLAFEPGLINSSDNIVVTYRYTGFGSGEQGIMTALGFYYDNGPVHAQNLTAYETGLKGHEAPDVGSEETASLKNATSVESAQTSARLMFFMGQRKKKYLPYRMGRIASFAVPAFWSVPRRR